MSKLSLLSPRHPQTGVSLVLSGLWPLAAAPCCRLHSCQCYLQSSLLHGAWGEGPPCHNHRYFKAPLSAVLYPSRVQRHWASLPCRSSWLAAFLLAVSGSLLQKQTLSYCSYTWGHCIVLGVPALSLSSETPPRKRICLLFSKIPKYF